MFTVISSTIIHIFLFLCTQIGFPFLSPGLAILRVHFTHHDINRRLLEKNSCWKVTAIEQQFGCYDHWITEAVWYRGILKWTSSEASDKACSELLQVSAVLRDQMAGGHFGHFIYHFSDRNLVTTDNRKREQDLQTEDSWTQTSTYVWQCLRYCCKSFDLQILIVIIWRQRRHIIWVSFRTDR